MSTDTEIHRTSPVHHRIGAAAARVVERTRVAFPVITFLAVTVVLLTVTQATPETTIPFQSLTGLVVTTDTAPLKAAGESTIGALGYVDFGSTHLYVTGKPVLVVVAGMVLASRGRIGTLAGIALGAFAAGMLVLVTGCPCGSGSATALWQSIH